MSEHNLSDTRTFRELSDNEIKLLAMLKQQGESLDMLLTSVELELKSQYGEAGLIESARFERAQPARWLAIARTHLQEGMMALSRCIAQPTSF